MSLGVLSDWDKDSSQQRYRFKRDGYIPIDEISIHYLPVFVSICLALTLATSPGFASSASNAS
jgi:hypothetical protein